MKKSWRHGIEIFDHATHVTGSAFQGQWVNTDVKVLSVHTWMSGCIWMKIG